MRHRLTVLDMMGVLCDVASLLLAVLLVTGNLITVWLETLMRIIEPVGRASSVPPTRRSSVSDSSLQSYRADSFYLLLQDAVSSCQRSSGKLLADRPRTPGCAWISSR